MIRHWGREVARARQKQSSESEMFCVPGTPARHSISIAADTLEADEPTAHRIRRQENSREAMEGDAFKTKYFRLWRLNCRKDAMYRRFLKLDEPLQRYDPWRA